MTIRGDLLDAGRALVIGLSDATDGKVINAGAKGPRPALPYVTARLTTVGGNEHGLAGTLHGLDDADQPTAVMHQRREAVLSLQGYGATTYDWLEAVQLLLDSPDSLDLQATHGVAVLLATPVRDLSALLDTSEETRCSLELRLRYTAHSTAQSLVALQRVEVDLDLQHTAADPDTLTADFALDAAGDLTD